MSDRAPLAWVLDFDADLELARGTPGYTAQRGLQVRMAAMREAFARELPEGDVVLDRDPDARARGLEGRCFCPTPRALERLARAGATVPAAPSFEVLRRCNARGFDYEPAELGEGLPGARCARRLSEVTEGLAPGRWLLKRAFSFSGRGQRRVDVPPGPSAADLAWVEASLRIGELVVEPRVEIVLELGLHGLLRRDGTIERGRLTVQDVDADGQWRASRLARASEVPSAESDALGRAFAHSAARLRDAGYFGPFGIDAFRYRDGDRVRLRAPSELNARYSMGWGVGMGGWR